MDELHVGREIPSVGGKRVRGTSPLDRQPREVLLDGSGKFNGAAAHRCIMARTVPAQRTTTVVIPTRDRLPLLREAVASVLAQDMSTWDLVVVDDASSDGTSEWVTGLADDRVRLIRLDEHVERSAARNRGLADAKAPTVLFLDDDDRLRASALRQLVDALDRERKAVAAFGAKEVFDGTGHHKRIPHPRVRFVRPVWDDVMAGWMFVSGQVLLRTEAVRAVGGWDETLAMAEDQDLWLRAVGHRPVVLLPNVVLEQRTRAEGVDANNVEEEVRTRLAVADDERTARLIEARRHLRAAGSAFASDDYRRATAALLAATRSAPFLLTSPIWGPQLLLSTAKGTAAAVLPGRSGRWARRAINEGRTRLGRNPVEPEPPSTTQADRH